MHIAAIVRSSSEQPNESDDKRHLARQGSIGIAIILIIKLIEFLIMKTRMRMRMKMRMI